MSYISTFDHSRQAAMLQVTQLVMSNVPWDLAERCAYILLKDDASLPNLGRTEEEQTTINEAYQYIKGDTDA